MIKTVNEFPPIPVRNFDWSCYDDSTYCGCGECKNTVGWGVTEAAAINDYQEQRREILDDI